MDKDKYKKTIYITSITYAVFMAVFTIVVFLWTKDKVLTVIVTSGMTFLCFLSYILHIADDMYISGIIIQLADLMDVLLFIDEHEIFPGSEIGRAHV